MAFKYILPASTYPATAPLSIIYDSSPLGSAFSVEMIGGYMEVIETEDLKLVRSDGGIPIIPVQGSATEVTTWLDRISSGRRKVGMLVFVIENGFTYQYTIPNYGTIWEAGELDGSIGYCTPQNCTISNAGGAGLELYNKWNEDSIEGITPPGPYGDYRWRRFKGTDVYVSGGTFTAGVNNINNYITFTNITGGTFTVTGMTDINVTGGTYNRTIDNVNNFLQFTNNTSGTFNVTGMTDINITGGTFFSASSQIHLYNNTGGTVVITGITSRCIRCPIWQDCYSYTNVS